jgi:hypothetical protein
MYYSKSTRGFYESDEGLVPVDIVEVSDNDYNLLFEGQSQGMEIVPNEAGYPILQACPAPTADELKAAANARMQFDFQNEADPLFFKWQRGECEQQVWLDKCAEIRARYIISAT